jgi:hypothetical protein
VSPFGIDFVTPGWVLVALWVLVAALIGCAVGWCMYVLRDDEGEWDYLERHRDAMAALRPDPGRGR